MTTTESACYSTPEEAGLRVERLPFARIPHQSKLFLDYLEDPLSLLRFYPEAVRYHHELAARAPQVLAAHATDRDALADALAASNAAWGAGAETLANVARGVPDAARHGGRARLLDGDGRPRLGRGARGGSHRLRRATRARARSRRVA
ncbi:MAG: hypothetical protein LC802_13095 [Acidobacteria bacterium]|nr:hypothetical protein [Acidobacteriota bacterium]